MIKGADLSVCRKYRYFLWRIWEEDNSYVAFIGLNPSTADEKKDDATIRRCIGYAKNWRFGGIYMLNLFAYRTTHPKELNKVREPVGRENDKFLKKYCDGIRCTVACWGINGTLYGRDRQVIELLGRDGLSCFGITKNGCPKHPLYLRRDTKLIRL